MPIFVQYKVQIVHFFILQTQLETSFQPIIMIEGCIPMGDGIQRKFAIIINGDSEKRHIANVERAIEALKAEDSSYEIAVAGSVQPKAAVSKFTDANEAGIKSIVSGLAKIDDDDLLVVYVTGHGNEGQKQEGCAALQDHSCFSLETLKQELARLHFGKRIVVMDQCYGGRGMRLFADLRTTVVTGGSPNEQVCCNKFSPYFWAKNVPDTDHDGVITVQERYVYALAVGKPETLTQYYSPSTAIGFSGMEDRSPSFSPQIQTVKNNSELTQKLRQIGPGEQALVMFSASWCSVCHGEPMDKFKQLAKNYNGRFLTIIAEGIDTNADEEWKTHYGINTFPLFALMTKRKDGSIKIVTVRDPANLTDDLINLANQNEQDEFSFYISKVNDPNFGMQLQAINVLGNMHDKADTLVPIFHETLKKETNTFVMEAIIEAIGKMGPNAETTIPTLQSILMDDKKHPDTRGLAVIALAKIGEKAAPTTIPLIAELLSTEHTEKMDYAISNACKIFGEKIALALPTLLDMAKKTETRSSLGVARILGFLGKAATSEAITCLKKISISDDSDISNHACYSLARLAAYNRPLFDEIIEQGTKGNEFECAAAAKILGFFFKVVASEKIPVDTKDMLPAAIAKLTSLLNHNAAKVRQASALSLGIIARRYLDIRKDIIGPLIEKFKDPNLDVKVQAILALKQEDITGFEAAYPHLLALLHDNNISVLAAVINTLLCFINKDNINVIAEMAINASRHEKEIVRIAATHAITAIVAFQSTNQQNLYHGLKEACLKLLRDPKRDVRGDAALMFINNNWSALRNSMDEIIPILSEETFHHMTDSQAQLAEQIAPELGQANNLDLNRLQILALREIGEKMPELRPRLIPIFIRGLKDDDDGIKIKCLEALYKYTKMNPSLARDIKPHLIPLINDDNNIIRMLTVKFMGEFGERADRSSEIFNIGVGPLINYHSGNVAIGTDLKAEYRIGENLGIEANFSVAKPSSPGFRIGESLGLTYHVFAKNSPPRKIDPYIEGPVIGAAHVLGDGNGGGTTLYLNPLGMGARYFFDYSTPYFHHSFIDGTVQWQFNLGGNAEQMHGVGVGVRFGSYF